MPSIDAVFRAAKAYQSPENAESDTIFQGASRIRGQARDAVLGDHIFNMNISRQDVDIKSIKILFLVNKITDHFPFLSIGACFDLLYPLSFGGCSR